MTKLLVDPAVAYRGRALRSPKRAAVKYFSTLNSGLFCIFIVFFCGTQHTSFPLHTRAEKLTEELASKWGHRFRVVFPIQRGGGAKFGIFATAARDKTVTKIVTKITIKLCNCQQKLWGRTFGYIIFFSFQYRIRRLFCLVLCRRPNCRFFSELR